MSGAEKAVVIEPITAFEAAPTLDVERDDKPQDECGVFGIYAPGEAVISKTIIGMEGLQHRGHSGAGIAYYIENVDLPAGKTNKPLVVHKGLGRVRKAIPEVYPAKQGTWDGFDLTTHVGVTVHYVPEESPHKSYDISQFDKQVGSRAAIGHTRYSTAETEDFDALHPHYGKESNMALAHNGHIDNMAEVAFKHGMLDLALVLTPRRKEHYGSDEEFEAAKQQRVPTDSEALAKVLDRKAAEMGGDLVAAMKVVLPDVNGAYCLTILHEGRLIAARDPWGFHPLAVGRIRGGKGLVIASEEVIFSKPVPNHPDRPEVGADYVRDVAAGEIVVIDEKGITSHMIDREEEGRLCAYEGIYIAREDGEVDGITVKKMRYNLGYFLGQDQPAEADIVVPVPASAIPSAEGYAEATGLPLVPILKKVKDIRSFLMRADERAKAIVEKYGIDAKLVELGRGKRWVLEDDSMIKGNTMKALVRFVREQCGATEVHVRLSSAEFRKACRMGLDTHDEWRLIASRMNTAEMADYIGADSVGFNTLERVQQAANEARVRPPGMGQKAGQLCMSCVTGEYPFPLPGEAKVVELPMPRPRAVDVDIQLPA